MFKEKIKGVIKMNGKKIDVGIVIKKKGMPFAVIAATVMLLSVVVVATLSSMPSNGYVPSGGFAWIDSNKNSLRGY